MEFSRISRLDSSDKISELGEKVHMDIEGRTGTESGSTHTIKAEHESEQHSESETELDPDSLFEFLIPHNVLLYVIPPMVDLGLEEFESLALERLQVLRILEHATAKGLMVNSDEWRETVLKELNNGGSAMKPYLRLCQGNQDNEQDMAARRKDYLSHFILRFAYCHSEDLRRWFLVREMEFFRLKFGGLSSQDVRDFVKRYEMDYTPLTKDEKMEIREGLYDSTSFQSVAQIEDIDFYRIPFTEVLDLIHSRKCYLHDGYAYVGAHDFISIIAGKHHRLVENGLESHFRLLPEIENDERFTRLLRGLHTTYTGKDYTVPKGDSIPVESLDQLSKKSYPLCMRACHDTLRTTHHLKHGGRMQYGLFLKAIGVTLEDSLRFWREEFTRGTVALEKFEKEYAYNIRHNYGKEGSRVNYSPYSCMKIITTNVGPQDTHGCPFRMWDSTMLKTNLSSYGLSAAHVDEIVTYAAKGHYQIACGQYWEVTHQTKLDEGISHPNQYFELSQITMGARAPPPPRNSVAAKAGGKQFRSHTASDIERFKDGTAELVASSSLDPGDDDELWELMESKEQVEKVDKHEVTDRAVENQESTSTLSALTSAKEASHWSDDDFGPLEDAD